MSAPGPSTCVPYSVPTGMRWGGVSVCLRLHPVSSWSLVHAFWFPGTHFPHHASVGRSVRCGSLDWLFLLLDILFPQVGQALTRLWVQKTWVQQSLKQVLREQCLFLPLMDAATSLSHLPATRDSPQWPIGQQLCGHFFFKKGATSPGCARIRSLM